MFFNPIFVQTFGQAETIDLPKQLKLNNPTYLFSDIIKIVSENSNSKITNQAGSNNLLLSSAQTDLQNLLSNLNAASVNDSPGAKVNSTLSANPLLAKELQNIGNAIADLLNTIANPPAINKNQSTSATPDQKKITDLANNILSLLQTNNPLILKVSLNGSDLSIKISKADENEVTLKDINGSDFNTVTSSNQIEPKIITGSTSNETLNTSGNNDGKIDLSKLNIIQSENVDNKISSLISSGNNAVDPSLAESQMEKVQAPKIVISVTKDNIPADMQNSQPVKSLFSKIGNGDWIEISLKNFDSQSHTVGKPALTDKTQNGETLQTQKDSVQIENPSIQKISDKINSETSLPPVKDGVVESPTNTVTKAEPVIISSERLSQNANDNTKEIEVSSSQNLNDPKIISNANQKFNHGDAEQNSKQASDKKEIFNVKNISNQAFTQDLTAASKKAITEQLPFSFDNKIKTVKANDLLSEINNIIQQGNTKSAVIKLDPENLGKVKIVLDVIDKAVHANIEVENENVKQIVQNNINDLKQSLNLNGLQLSSINVSLNSGDEKANKSFQQKKKNGFNQYDRKIEETGDAFVSKSLGYNTYDYLI
ncbi:MAG: flagellar hook-length control protein FliK [Ignavibacteriaceae bacterium]